MKKGKKKATLSMLSVHAKHGEWKSADKVAFFLLGFLFIQTSIKR